MKAKEYTLLVNCVDTGVEYGWLRAFKYSETPTPEMIRNYITEAVLIEVCEAFWLNDEEELPH